MSKNIMLFFKFSHVAHIILVNQNIKLALPGSDRLGIGYKYPYIFFVEILDEFKELI